MSTIYFKDNEYSIDKFIKQYSGLIKVSVPAKELMLNPNGVPEVPGIPLPIITEYGGIKYVLTTPHDVKPDKAGNIECLLASKHALKKARGHTEYVEVDYGPESRSDYKPHRSDRSDRAPRQNRQGTQDRSGDRARSNRGRRGGSRPDIRS